MINTFSNYIYTSNLFWLVLTVSTFKLGVIVYTKTKKHVLFQPIFVALIIIITTIYISNTSYDKYHSSVDILDDFLGVITVSLAIPLYYNLKTIKSFFPQIIITLIVGSLFTIAVSELILYLLDSSLSTMLSMSTKSISAPIAIITSDQIGAISALAVTFILITGVLGALLCPLIFKLFKIDNEIVQGFTLGLISHGIGTAKAVEISQKAVAFSILGMSLNGVFTAFSLPIIISILK